MKKATQRIHASPTQETAPTAPGEGSGPCPGRKNYLGLNFQTEIGGFFTENPVNSAFLAVDRLGLGPLTLNQTTGKKLRSCASIKTEQGKGEAPSDSVETGYMDALRQSREQRKFEVRVRE